MGSQFMKLSASNIAWDAVLDQEMYGFLENNGFTGLEIAPTRLFSEAPYGRTAEMKNLSDQLRSDYGLVIASMQSIWYGKQENIFGSKEEQNALIAYTNRAVDFAKAASCKNLVFGCPKNRNVPENNRQESVIPFFYVIAQYAMKQGVTIALEPNPVIYGTNFINTTESAFDFVKSVQSDGLKVNMDMGTIIYNQEDLSMIENNLSFIHHIHISEPGLEQIQIRSQHLELAALLRHSHYPGYISLEMKNPGDITQVKDAVLKMREVFH